MTRKAVHADLKAVTPSSLEYQFHKAASGCHSPLLPRPILPPALLRIRLSKSGATSIADPTQTLIHFC